MKNKGIKQILKKQIKNDVDVLWKHNKKLNKFIMIYEDFDNRVKYTPKQLLAIDLISSNPMVSTDSVAKNIGVTSRTINN